jgi:hypothetical protein
MAVEAWLDPARSPADLPGPADPAVGVDEAWQPPVVALEATPPLPDAGAALPVLARVVTGVGSALSAARLDPDRVVRVLAATVALARAAGAPEEAVVEAFLAATAVLERDLDTIERRIAEGREEPLLQAAATGRTHAADMAVLLEQHAEALRAAGGDGDAWTRAVAAVARLEALTDEVVAVLAGQADDRVRPAPPAGPRALGELVARTDLAELAELAGGIPVPPTVPATHPAAAFAALDEQLGRPHPRSVPIPEPVALAIEPPEDVPDLTTLAALALEWLAGRGGAELTDWVVGGSWAEATGRMAAVVEAWSRHGPGGDQTLDAELEASPVLDPVGRDGVAALSRTLVRPREASG